MTDSTLFELGPDVARSAAVREIGVSVTSDLTAVAGDWRALANGVRLDSPGQSLAFARLWVERLGIAAPDRVFVTCRLDGVPVALLPLRRRWVGGLRVATWLFGRHVGCNVPLVDAARLAALSAEDRKRVWRSMAARVPADLLYLPAVPDDPLFAGLGTSIAGDTLHRAEFSSWEEADRTQRNKSRRKHDRQQGEKLSALGAVTFEELDSGRERAAILDIMFRQRAARFVAMGVADPFADAAVRSFYGATLDPASGVAVKLHVLRLEGEVVAVRYNVVAGDRLFCLISSMSTDPVLQPGSPGKQCLLRVMQTAFDAGCRSFDMGAGLTDEKRHWCNVQVPLRQHYVALTVQGHLAVAAHRLAQSARSRIKSDPRLLAMAKAVRGRLMRRPEAAPPPPGEQG